MRRGIIYKCVNNVNGKIYIGQTIQSFERRKQIHLAQMRLGSKSPFHRAIKKYGIENFDWSVLYDDVPAPNLNAMERWIIDAYDSYRSGYNLTLGGNQSYGFSHSAKTKKKMSASAKKRFAEGPSKNPMYGKSAFDVWEELYGKEKAEELKKAQYQKLSETLKGKNTWTRGRKLSEEHKKKIAEGVKRARS